MATVGTITSVRSARRPAGWLVVALITAAAVAVFLGTRALRSDGGTTRPLVHASGMPTSSEIENTYGVIFDRVVVTASGGMLQIHYTIADQSKAAALHDQATVPYLQMADGTKFNEPGIAGHGHSAAIPAVGAGGYMLLSNNNGSVRGGTEVSIHMGKLHLDHVIVEG